ncbi:MAG: transglutaminase-like domain-containing protein [Elusimicrobiota bacterium]|jgi:regulator of sirC expression with transglutaminase-like and TPR domain
MKSLTESEMRSLVTLLDDDDQASVSLIRSEILKVGEPMLPYLDEYRTSCASGVAGLIESIKLDLRFQRLKEAFEGLSAGADPDLEEGAFLLCRFGYPQVNPLVYREWLDRVAADVRKALPSDPDAYSTMQQLNIRLFQDLGFAGNEEDYYDPDNSFLHRVIEARRGIPVTLSVLYLLVAARLGLPVHGIGTPGHFLVGFTEARGSTFFIDTFHRGKLMNSQDVRRMLTRTGYDFRPEFLAPVSARETIVRMMRNLIAVYHKTGAAPRAEKLGILAEIVLRGART